MKRRPLRARSIRFESLERRELLVADLGFEHNFVMPEDTDASGTVAPMDALMVINQLNARSDNRASLTTTRLLDVNADGKVTPLDALYIINCLNGHRNDGQAVPSGVDTSQRISRIEAAIQTGQIPFNVSLDRAQEILATLRAGGRPELGQHMVGNALYEDNVLASPQDKLAQLSEQLSLLGVDPSAIEKITSQVQSALDAGQKDLRNLIKTELDAAGIDFAELLQTRCQDDMLDAFATKLESVGVNPDIVGKVIGQVKEAIAAGETDIKSLIQSKLQEAGIDLKSLVADIKPSQILDKLSERLGQLGVDPTKIESLIKDIKTAIANGQTDLHAFIKSKLKDAGIDLTNLIENFRQQEFLNKLASRLEKAGVDPQTISQIVSDVRSGIDAGTKDLRALVKATLQNAGVDLPTLINDQGSQRLLDQLAKRLSDLGIEQTKIGALIQSIQQAKADGLAITASLLFDKLKSAGIDPALVLRGVFVSDNTADPKTGSEPVEGSIVKVREIIGKLKLMGISQTTIDFILNGVATKVKSGIAVTGPVFISILIESGGVRPELIQHLRDFLDRN